MEIFSSRLFGNIYQIDIVYCVLTVDLDSSKVF